MKYIDVMISLYHIHSCTVARLRQWHTNAYFQFVGVGATGHRGEEQTFDASKSGGIEHNNVSRYGNIWGVFEIAERGPSSWARCSWDWLRWCLHQQKQTCQQPHGDFEAQDGDCPKADWQQVYGSTWVSRCARADWHSEVGGCGSISLRPPRDAKDWRCSTFEHSAFHQRSVGWSCYSQGPSCSHTGSRDTTD